MFIRIALDYLGTLNIIEHDANWVRHFMMMAVNGTKQI